MEATPNQVPKQAKLFGEILDRWSWVELSVWTERMLTALERGVKEKCWLLNALFAEQGLFTLVTAFATVCQPSKR
jgi:hypothetical protein